LPFIGRRQWLKYLDQKDWQDVMSRRHRPQSGFGVPLLNWNIVRTVNHHLSAQGFVISLSSPLLAISISVKIFRAILE
jgi:hypothetical protein